MHSPPRSPSQLHWLFDIPSIWIWQLFGWTMGVDLLAYYLELGIAAKIDGDSVTRGNNQQRP
ncbi:MAG: hypothetical protein U1F42_07720 [Candidatus Competibacteraceae bacterium]